MKTNILPKVANNIHKHKQKIQEIKRKGRDAINNYWESKYIPKTSGQKSYRGKTRMKIKNEIEYTLNQKKTKIDTLNDEIIRLYQMQMRNNLKMEGI